MEDLNMKNHFIEQPIIEKYIYLDDDDSIEMHVDPVSGSLKISTREEIISIPNKSAYVLLNKARTAIVQWEENSKRSKNFGRKLFLF